MGSLAEKYGYGDSGECLTVADKNEVWQFEIVGIGKDKIGAAWVAKRIPDDHVGVSANIPRIGRIDRKDKDMMASANVEKVARENGLWDGKGEFVFWKAFNTDYANGKNFNDREFFILNYLAPSLHLSYDMEELPFSVKPEKLVDIREVMALYRETYEGTDFDMTRNVKLARSAKHRRVQKDRSRCLVRLFACNAAEKLASRRSGWRMLALPGQPRPEPPRTRFLRHHKTSQGIRNLRPEAVRGRLRPVAVPPGQQTGHALLAKHQERLQQGNPAPGRNGAEWRPHYRHKRRPQRLHRVHL